MISHRTLTAPLDSNTISNYFKFSDFYEQSLADQNRNFDVTYYLFRHDAYHEECNKYTVHTEDSAFGACTDGQLLIDALQAFIIMDKLDMVKDLLSNEDFMTYARTNQIKYAHFACHFGKLHALILLIEHDLYDPDYKVNMQCQTPSEERIVKLLKFHKKTVNLLEFSAIKCLFDDSLNNSLMFITLLSTKLQLAGDYILFKINKVLNELSNQEQSRNKLRLSIMQLLPEYFVPLQQLLPEMISNKNIATVSILLSSVDHIVDPHFNYYELIYNGLWKRSEIQEILNVLSRYYVTVFPSTYIDPLCDQIKFITSDMVNSQEYNCVENIKFLLEVSAETNYLNDKCMITLVSLFHALQSSIAWKRSHWSPVIDVTRLLAGSSVNVNTEVYVCDKTTNANLVHLVIYTLSRQHADGCMFVDFSSIFSYLSRVGADFSNKINCSFYESTGLYAMSYYFICIYMQMGGNIAYSRWWKDHCAINLIDALSKTMLKGDAELAYQQIIDVTNYYEDEIAEDIYKEIKIYAGKCLLKSRNKVCSLYELAKEKYWFISSKKQEKEVLKSELPKVIICDILSSRR